jgi:thiamine pyrophosphate-dependent acetolactate synthase large subunit-like protein
MMDNVVISIEIRGEAKDLLHNLLERIEEDLCTWWLPTAKHQTENILRGYQLIFILLLSFRLND